MSAKVLVVMGSDSDWSVMESCVEQLQKFDIEAEVRVCSAHRTPEVAQSWLVLNYCDRQYPHVPPHEPRNPD